MGKQKTRDYSYPILAGLGRYDLNDKKINAQYYARYFLARTQTMFEYSGLPPNIPQVELERLIQCNGFACIGKDNNGDLYAFRGALGGAPNPYYMPTLCIVANPALNFSKEFKINTDCVIVKNDSYYCGILPLVSRYSVLLAENDISLRLADVNSRIISLIIAPDANTAKSAECYLEKVERGELGVVMDDNFIDSIKTQNYSNASAAGFITDLIELHQYLKASCFNELGINSNYNMKREALNSEESQLNHDALLPLVDDMLRCRKEGVAAVNSMFGTKITVELGGVWREQRDRTSNMGAIISAVK